MADQFKIRQAPGTYVIRADGAVIGESTRALELTEGSHPPVIYVPREDVAMALLDATDRQTAKDSIGQARHYSIVTGNRVLQDAVWSYEDPQEGLDAIAGHLAFHADKVTVARN